MNIEYLLIYSVFCRGVCGNLELEKKTANTRNRLQAGKLASCKPSTAARARKGGGVQEKAGK